MLDAQYFKTARILNKTENEAEELRRKMKRHRDGLNKVFERFDQGHIRESIAEQFVRLYTEELLRWEVELIVLEDMILQLKKELAAYY